MKNAWFAGSSSEVNTTHLNGSLPNYGYLHTYLDHTRQVKASYPLFI